MTTLLLYPPVLLGLGFTSPTPVELSFGMTEPPNHPGTGRPKRNETLRPEAQREKPLGVRDGPEEVSTVTVVEA